MRAGRNRGALLIQRELAEEREKAKNPKVKDKTDLIRDRKHETDFEGGNGVGVAILHQV